jgi:periplasmic protein TonB
MSRFKLFKISILILACLIFSDKAFSQADTLLPKLNGYIQYVDFIKENIKYPPVAVENGITGRVIFNFMVTKTGCIDSIRIVSKTHESLNKEVIKALNKTECNWAPARINNIPQNLILHSFIDFSLESRFRRNKK